MSNAPKHIPKRTHPGSNSSGKRLASVGLTLALGMLISSQSAAETLDGEAVKQLALQGTWMAENASYGNWSWSSDNTVCLRILKTDGDCADTGTWRIDSNLICYELNWWGKAEDVHAQCVSIDTLGDGRYEALYHGGAMVSTFMKFKVLSK